MDFTDLYRHTHAQVSFSPGRHFILTAINDRIVVRKSSTFTITASFQADLTPSTTSSVLAGKPSARLLAAEASITQCTWSPDSEYILAACPRRGVVNIFALRDTTWNARIEAGVEGLVRVEWAPDSRHILCFSEFGVRTQVLDWLWAVLIACIVAAGHNLVSCYWNRDIYSVSQVSGERCVELIGFCGQGLGLKLRRTRLSKRWEVLCPCRETQVQRRNRRVRCVRFLQAHKSKLETSSLERVLDHFQQITLPTSSLGGLSLSPTGNYLAIWEGPLDYKLYIYNLAGQQIATFEPEEITTLGIRTVAWHPSGLFLAVGGWDDRVLPFLRAALHILTFPPLDPPPNLLLMDTDSNHPTYLSPSVWRIGLA